MKRERDELRSKLAERPDPGANSDRATIALALNELSPITDRETRLKTGALLALERLEEEAKHPCVCPECQPRALGKLRAERDDYKRMAEGTFARRDAIVIERDRLAARVEELETKLAGTVVTLRAANDDNAEWERMYDAAEARAAEANALTESIRQQYAGFRETTQGLGDRVAAAEARAERMAAVVEAAHKWGDEWRRTYNADTLRGPLLDALSALDAAGPRATVAAPTCRTDADHAKRLLDERRASGDARAAAEPELVRQCENCGGRAFALSDSPMSGADCEKCGTIDSADVAMPDVAKPADPPSDAPEGTT